jgi:hypothetical protein
VRPSPLKSPVSTLTLGSTAQAAKSVALWFVTLQVPSPLENATGTLAQRAPPVSLPEPLVHQAA